MSLCAAQRVSHPQLVKGRKTANEESDLKEWWRWERQAGPSEVPAAPVDDNPKLSTWEEGGADVNGQTDRQARTWS